MINLMYLVLTALLALNVSSEILNAFRTMDNSLHNANNTIDDKNQTLFNSFNELKKDSVTAQRARYWGDRADEAKRLADNMITYIEGLKVEIKKAADINEKGEYKEDNLEAATRVMTDPGTKGEELRNALATFKTALLNVDDSVKHQLSNQLPIDLTSPASNNTSSQKSWASGYFNMTPAIAAVAILSKFENDVKNSEAMVIDYCHQQVGAVKVVYDQYQALVGQSSNYLMPGQEMTITAGVGTYASAAQPVITIDGQRVPINQKTGAAEYKFVVGGTANDLVKNVHIEFFNQSLNRMDKADFPVKYSVGSPTGASVSADDVKVLYIDLDNHLTINGGNVGAEKVHASMENGSLQSLGNGKYIAHPGKPGTANIVLNIDGQQSQKFQFKVKQVPDPIGMVGLSKGGPMPVNDFKSQSGVRAELENFIFEGVRFSVQSYTIVVTGGKKGFQYKQVVGNSFGPVQDIIDGLGPNTNVTIDEIMAVGPGGARQLPPITFNLR